MEKTKKTHKKIVEGPWRNITDETIVKISRYSVLALGDPVLLWWGRKKRKRKRKALKRGWVAGDVFMCSVMRRQLVACGGVVSVDDDWGIDMLVLLVW